MSKDKSYPTAPEFLIKIPLYEKIEYDEEHTKDGLMVRYFSETFDSYCPYCNSHSIFEPIGNGYRHYSVYPEDNWIDAGFFEIAIRCTRSHDHKLYFHFHCSGREIEKIGQKPSIADLNLFDVKKYAKVLEKSYFQEFTKAIGLAAHGIGVGSFVYLRRIFEHLIESAHKKAQTNADWNDDAFTKARMGEKIELLAHELPEFLVENRSIYSILSKGIHELSEIECINAFPIMKVGIEIILEEKLEALYRQQKLDEARKAIASISSRI